MKMQSIILAGLLLLLVSCGKEVDNQMERSIPVRVHVSDFSFSNEDFPAATTRAESSPVSYASIRAIDVAIFSGNTRVYAATQLKDDASTYTTFGEFECRLPIGTYTMVAVARNRSDGDEFTITSPTQAAYTTERARETFCNTQTIQVDGTTPVDVSPVMNRVMAMFWLTSTDAVPADVSRIRTTYTAGSKSFNPTTGLATDDDGFVVTNSAKPDKNGVLDIFSIVFLAADQETMDLTIDVLDANNTVLLTKHLKDVHFRRNQITKATGAVFTPDPTTLTFTLNTTWLPDEHYNF
jgi:hypothetical protein